MKKYLFAKNIITSHLIKLKRAVLLLILLLALSNVNAAAPTITSFSPTSGAVGTLVTINGTSLDNTTAFTIGGTTALVISNTGTVLRGLVMPGATTGTISVTNAGGSITSSTNFTLSAPVLPTTQQGSKFLGTGSVGAGLQGCSVAVSADGNTAIVGAYYDNTFQGAAWIYTRSGGVWSQQGNKLVGTGGIGNTQQGVSVGISADGNTAIVGGFGDNTLDGAAWIFTRSGGVWSQQGSKLGGMVNAVFGTSISMSADGNTVVVGGYNDNAAIGALWVYTRSGGVWTQQGSKLVGTGTVGQAHIGWSTAISADGNTIITGAENDNSGQGAAWIFTRSGITWSQQGSKLVGTGSVGAAKQGTSVAINADGNTVMVGGFADNGNQGAAWVYTRSGGVWTQQGSKLVGTGSVNNPQQGRSVALSADGNIAIIGGPQDNAAISSAVGFNKQINSTGGSQSNSSIDTSATFKQVNATGSGIIGAIWLFTRSGGSWSQLGSKLAASGSIGSAQEGYSVAISADGGTAIIGGPADNSNIGTAWAFSSNTAPSSNASLSALSTTAGTLSPVFSTSTTAYTVSVSNATTSITVTPTSGDVNAIITVNGSAVSSGSASSPLALVVGSNVITVLITAPDGVTTQTYVITVTRALANQTITFTAIPAKTYGIADFAPGATSDNSTIPITYSSDNTAVATMVSGNIHIVAVGTANITASQAGNANYNAATNQTQQLTVNKGVQNITFTTTAWPTKSYGNADFAPGATSDNSAIPITYSSDNTAVATIVNGNIHIVAVGTANITASQAGNANYNAATNVTRQLTVNKASQTITFAALATKSLGGADFSPGATSDNSTIPITYTSDNPAVVTIVNGNIHIVAIGTANITASQTGNANYNAATSVTQAITITNSGGNDIVVHPAVSPNGDNINDVLYIEGIKNYSTNKVTIVNRDGVKVFTMSGYDNASRVFDGHSSITGTLQQQGTYFYLIEYEASGQQKRKTGYFVLRY